MTPIHKTCTRCNGGGYIATKNGGSKRCPFCNPAHQSAQLTHEAVGWLYWCVVAFALATLLLGSVAGHWWVSLGVGA